MEADLDGDGKYWFEESTKLVENTDISQSMTLDLFSERTKGHISLIILKKRRRSTSVHHFFRFIYLTN